LPLSSGSNIKIETACLSQILLSTPIILHDVTSQKTTILNNPHSENLETYSTMRHCYLQNRHNSRITSCKMTEHVISLPAEVLPKYITKHRCRVHRMTMNYFSCIFSVTCMVVSEHSNETVCPCFQEYHTKLMLRMQTAEKAYVSYKIF
jgi:hypothetical protein